MPIPALMGFALPASECMWAGRPWLPRLPPQRRLQRRRQCRPRATLTSQLLLSALRRRRQMRHLLPRALLRSSLEHFLQHDMRWPLQHRMSSCSPSTSGGAACEGLCRVIFICGSLGAPQGSQAVTRCMPCTHTRSICGLSSCQRTRQAGIRAHVLKLARCSVGQAQR